MFDGEKKRIDDILNQEILILRFKIKKYEEHVPFYTTIKKIDRYFTMS